MILRGPLRAWIISRIPPRVRVRARYWYRAARGRLDRELRLLAQLVEPGTVAVDVGAHDGIYSYFFSRHGLTVHAFEPLPGHAAVLRRGLPDVMVHEAALGPQAGSATLLVPTENGQPAVGRAFVGASDASGAQSYQIRLEALDGLNLRGVSVIKIDVEGNELAVLHGAEDTLARELPLLLLELEERHVGREGWSATTSWLFDRGYRGYFIAPDGGVRELASFDHSTFQRVHGGVPLEPYVNNFFFAPRHTRVDELLGSVVRGIRPRGL